jgi:hypothetical protein
MGGYLVAEPKLRLKLPEFIQEGEGSKTRLYVLLAILAVVSVVAIVVNLGLSINEEPPPKGIAGEIEPGDLNREIAQLLPQLARQEDEVLEEKNTFNWEEVDPFALPMELVGIVTGGNRDLAIIKARHTTYIASQGEKIADTWEVVEINRDSVRLKGDTEEIVVELRSRD